MNNKLDATVEFTGNRDGASATIQAVYDALNEKGYAASNQIVGYLISGDPTYITSFNNARYLIRMLERDELLEELVRFYVNAPEHKAQTELER